MCLLFDPHLQFLIATFLLTVFDVLCLNTLSKLFNYLNIAIKKKKKKKKTEY